MSTPAGENGLRIVGLADTDSYVKWGAALLGSLPDGSDVTLLIVDTSLVVTPDQEASALAGSRLDGDQVVRVAYGDLEATLQELRPDAVLLAARGPVVRVLARLVAGLQPRPVIVAGLPGISIPATNAALVHRTQADLFVLHSLREIREFRRVARHRGHDQRFALASLPFAAHRTAARSDRRPLGATDLVFAAQAIVPRERSDRLRIARLLVEAARAEPSKRVVVKVRGRLGDPQTHPEVDGYPELLRSLGPVPENLVVSTAPMAWALDTAEGLVTVSSTAAVEAVGRGIPVIALDSFGVADELINPVFLGSGLFGDEADVVARAFRHPRGSWLDENYFHDRSQDDWYAQLCALVDTRRAGALAEKAPLRRRGGRVRDVWDRKIALGGKDRTIAGYAVLAVGLPLREATRVVNAVRGAFGADRSGSGSARERLATAGPALDAPAATKADANADQLDSSAISWAFE